MKADYVQASTQQLPNTITIRTPTADKTSALTRDFPFQIFETNLRLGTQEWSSPNFPAGSSHIRPGLMLCGRANDAVLDVDESFGYTEDFLTLPKQSTLEANSIFHTASDIWTPDSSVAAALKSVVPKIFSDEAKPGSSTTSLNTQIFPSSLHRQVLFSVANNFAGLEAIPIKHIFHFLQKETDKNFYQLVRSSARTWSSRAIIQNLFEAAIEAGDAKIVDVLIRENCKDIDVNKFFLSFEGFRYTPIERASQLRYKDVVKNLLDHGADVNRTYRYENCCSALDYAVYWDECSSRFRLDTQIFRILLEKGGDLSYQGLRQLIQSKDEDLVILFISTKAGQHAASWTRESILHEAMESLDDDTSAEIIRIMSTYGVDLNCDGYLIQVTYSRIQVTYSRFGFPGESQDKMIDFAARGGKTKTVRILLDSGAFLTGNTLPAAVASGNRDLIQLVITNGADINGIGSWRTTALAEAIRLQNTQVLRIVEDHGAFHNMLGEEQFSAALRAASEVENFQLIERLLDLRGDVSPGDFGLALILATRQGRDEVAKSFIDAGANVNRVLKNKSPLVEALKRQKEAIVMWLLDADADPKFDPRNDPTFDCVPEFVPPMILAVEWGNRSVIESLILAGADVNKGTMNESALTIAVKCQDYELIHLLLASGADLNDYQRRDSGWDQVGLQKINVLKAAVQTGDLEMVRFLLDQGADPDNPAALRQATLENDELVDLLLERYRTRYPARRSYFGVDVLVRAVFDGNERVIKMMLEKGISAKLFSYEDGVRATPFGHAIARQESNFTGCLELFLQNGCRGNDIVAQATDWDPDPPTPPRITALLAAIGSQNISAVELLIRYEADVNFPTRARIKRTPLQRAAEVGSLDILNLLLNHGANVHAPAAERSGGTALQLAAIGGYVAIACKLLSLKADPNAPASKVNGRTALEGAAEHGRLDMVQLLLNGGAGSRQEDEGQVANAITLARDNGHIPICDLLESHFSSKRQGSGLELLADDNNGDLTDFNLDDDPFSFVDFDGTGSF